ncbi:MAG: VCBS repeat-containing protein [Algoriphagus sp.]|nr:VCBS repeat-containing protein [Algoriphagus sp.]
MKVLSFFFAFFLVFIVGCNPISERKQPPLSLEQLASSDLNLNGERLAEAYCGSCHLKPEPEILDRITWETKVLPDMRKRMGLYLEEDFGTELPEDSGVPPGIYSKVQLIKREDWAKIQEYYLGSAPEKPLPQVEKVTPKVGIPGFKEDQPAFSKIFPSLTTMVRIHPETGDLWVGNRFRSLFILDSKNGFKLKDSIPTDVAPVEILWNKDQSFELLTMGLMDPSKDTLGALSGFSSQNKSWSKEILLDKLIRPVHVETADWNADGVLDRVVSHFGDHFGKLSLYLSENGQEKEIILKPVPGARRTIGVDFDEDGDLDILSQIAQAQEGVYVWINQGEGKFVEKSLLRFQPSFGSSDFRFEDVNGDGHRDIILVNGNNADLSQILKNYHGVRIFLNDGDGEFEQEWFYPLFGASGLEVDDFDLDGDLDLFVLSFFPDPKQAPRQDLIYFRQSGNGDFEPFVLKKNIESHWLTMTKGDSDRDGDIDLVVGTFEFNDLYGKPSKPWKPFIILWNELK